MCRRDSSLTACPGCSQTATVNHRAQHCEWGDLGCSCYVLGQWSVGAYLGEVPLSPQESIGHLVSDCSVGPDSKSLAEMLILVA